MIETPVETLHDFACELGESTLWDDVKGRLHWVDIDQDLLFTLDWATREVATLQLPYTAGSVGLRAGGGLVAALRHAVAFIDVDTGLVEIVAELETDLPGNRCNDGAVDPAGRFWFGTMDVAETGATGAFYRFDEDLAVTKAFGGVIVSNGPAWSPDGRTMYHVDSARSSITAYEFDPVTGAVGGGRLFVSDEDEAWFPDGVTVDADGYVWNCKWDGGRIVRYSPDGRVDRVVEVPVPRPTRCAFVGPDLDQLAVTSARRGRGAEAPRSGHLLLLDPGTRGLPAPRYQG
ncbi:SMP-30/gluconolactonase/LRE family protein [Dactylosporangium sp. NPDC049525]|uniref:SMP-30/gluconolactonase/LRE family protein n=1 Tax=Dactylosporangium sp. NPDC049525 TaxID=3154730 RepID=UPI0034477A43